MIYHPLGEWSTHRPFVVVPRPDSIRTMLLKALEDGPKTIKELMKVGNAKPATIYKYITTEYSAGRIRKIRRLTDNRPPESQTGRPRKAVEDLLNPSEAGVKVTYLIEKVKNG